MLGVGHIDAIPLAFDGSFVHGVKIGVETKEHNVLRPREHADQIQDVGKRDADPFGDEGSALFAGLMVDVALGWKPF